MNLIIDSGNTRAKVAVFEKNTIIKQFIIPSQQLVETIHTEIIKKYPIDYGIISNVGFVSSKDIGELEKSVQLVTLNHTTKIPFLNLYKTPETLGVDRIALIAAASQQYPGKHTLVVDAGTCITYDFKNNKEEYLGGAIAPGITMRYKSLHQYTSKLPLLSKIEASLSIGASTEEAIHTGVSGHTALEIDAVIDQYCNNYPDLTVILTGGDAHFLSKRLKNSIFATSNFLLEGLNHILAFNNSQ
ncbi:type III pantothenate kinase [Aquimarina sp. ERC-38]|uniref:type III pantothenate kinase n=1 Tax=Aquimarina sp. ERC-38 TaxID=2949996 RepID=UPI002245210A|nr:type III pantothenate kinase [Aquimarina sp. ERC-38]UZO81451.1 type III pantothenate kinase [Aquimarina sp. ERC-38]